MRLIHLAWVLALVFGCSKTQATTPGTGGTTGSGGDDAGAGGTSGPLVAALTVTPSTVNLGGIEPGATGTAKVTVTNTGGLMTGAIILTPSAGVTATGCSAPLAAGASCTITITVAPASPGSFSGTVAISASPGADAPLLVALITYTTGGVFTVSPPVIDLGNVASGTLVSRQLTITISVPLDDLAISAQGPDVTINQTATTCTSTLARGATCVVVVDFFTATSGIKNDSVVISAGGTNGKIVTVSITAAAQKPASLAINSDTLQSVSCGSPLTFAVANAGGMPTGQLSVTLTGPNPDAFMVTNSTCLVLAPLAGCTLSVGCKPGSVDGGGPAHATLTVTDTGASGSSVQVELSEWRPSLNPLTIYPGASTMDLGSVTVGATGTAFSFTVVNSDDAPTGDLSVSVSSNEFLITQDTCSGLSLARDQSCAFSMALNPTTTGEKIAVLAVTGASGIPAVKTLSGTGILGGEPDAGELDAAELDAGKLDAAELRDVSAH